MNIYWLLRLLIDIFVCLHSCVMCFKYDQLLTPIVTGKHHSYSVRCSLSCHYGDQNLQQKSSAVLPTAAINELEFLATLVQLQSAASARSPAQRSPAFLSPTSSAARWCDR